MKKLDREVRIDLVVKRFLKKHPSFSPNPLGEWSDLVGPQVARYSVPKSLKNKVLTVLAYDSIWKHHLELNKESLLAKINQTAPDPRVEKIVIRVGEVPDQTPVLNPNYRLLEKVKAKKTSSRKRKKTRSQPLTEEEKALLAKLGDPELRAVGKKLLQRLPTDDSED